VVTLLLATRLTAAAFARDFSPFSLIGLPSTHAARAWLLVLAVGLLATLVWLVVRHGERMLWLSGSAGGVLAPAADLESLLAAAACSHPEVVRAHVRLGMSGRALTGTVQLFCRPLVDPAPVAADVGGEARRQLSAVTGREAAGLVVRARVLSVRQLTRYLP
jgi:hypothetical protein